MSQRVSSPGRAASGLSCEARPHYCTWTSTDLCRTKLSKRLPNMATPISMPASDSAIDLQEFTRKNGLNLKTAATFVVGQFTRRKRWCATFPGICRRVCEVTGPPAAMMTRNLLDISQPGLRLWECPPSIRFKPQFRHRGGSATGRDPTAQVAAQRRPGIRERICVWSESPNRGEINRDRATAATSARNAPTVSALQAFI